MARTKKISVNAFEKVVKNGFNNIVEEDWNGLTISITHTISLQDVFNLVAEVVDNCFMGDGSYMPEAMQPLLDCAVVEKYTNISLPANLEARYELVMKSGIMDFILPKINNNQYNDIVLAVRDKIDYMCDANTIAFNNAINTMNSAMTNIQNGMTGLIDQYSSVDGAKIEERIVSEYLKKNAEMRVAGGK